MEDPMDHVPLIEWIKKFDAGEYSDPGFDTQIKAGWYDWFCHDRSLRSKTYKLAPKVKKIAKSPKVNVERTYVFFKNNCPVHGSLYDDFRICDMETGDVIFTIVPRTGHKVKNGVAEVWGRENGFKGPLVEGTWEDVKKFFGV
jgi:hypothetical protein